MIESYRIGVSLLLESNVAGTVPSLIREFEKLDRIIKDTASHTSDLGSALRGIARAASGLNDTAFAAERLKRALDGAAAAAQAMNAAAPNAASGVNAAAQNWTNAAQQMNAAAQQMQRVVALPPGGGYGPPGFPRSPLAVPGGGGPGGPGIPLTWNPGPGPGGSPQLPTAGDYATAGLGLMFAGQASRGYLESTFGAAASIDAIRARMAQQGYTPEQIAAAEAASYATQRNVPGAFVTEAMQDQLEYSVITRHPDEARERIGDIERARIVLRNMKGEHGGLDNLFKAFQAGELRGAITNDDQFAQFVRDTIDLALVTGGRIGPAEALKFAQNAGASGAVVSRENMFGTLIPAMLSMGANRAGTGLNAFFQQFAAGRMSQASARMLQNMGVIHSDVDLSDSRPDGRGVGMGQIRLRPGDVDFDLTKMAARNPFEFIRDVLVPAIHQRNVKDYGEDSPERLTATIVATLARIPGANITADVARLMVLSSKYAGAMADASKRDPYAIAQKDNPNVTVQQFHAALEALLATLGNASMGAATGSLKDVTAAINGLEWVASKWPATGRALFDIAAGLAFLGTVAGGVLLAIAPIMALRKIALAAGVAGGAGAAAGGAGAFMRMGSLLLKGGGPIAGGLIAGDVLDGDDHIGAWIDKHVPGAAAVDDWFYRHTGGAVGRSAAPDGGQGGPNKMEGKVYFDKDAVGTFVAQHMANGIARPPAGPTGPDVRYGLNVPGLGIL